jgi:fatty acid desaturase
MEKTFQDMSVPMDNAIHSEQRNPAAKGYSTLTEIPAVLKGLFGKRTGKAGTNAYQRFRKDPYYLPKYYFANIAILGLASILAEIWFPRLHDFRFLAFWFAGLILFVLPSFSLIFLSGLYYFVLICLVQPQDLTLSSLALVPVGILAGTISAALMHNAAHGNFRHGWENRLWGELCGLFQLTGFAGWCISHFIHHAAPDDPAKDAHPPGHTTFREYVNAMGQMMKTNLTDKYFETFGDNAHARSTWSLVAFLLPFVRYLRVAFVLLLLGPTLFVMLFVPFKMANTLIYGDFNYRTHRPTADGGFEVLNLNHSIWYKLLNAISFGSYFHKNHHRNANVFDPRYAGNDDLPLVTYRR